jgi:hypothetical protein
MNAPTFSIPVFLQRRFALGALAVESEDDEKRLAEAIGVLFSILEATEVFGSLDYGQGLELHVEGPGCPTSSGCHRARLYLTTTASRASEEKPPQLLVDGEADEEAEAPDGCRGAALAVRDLINDLRRFSGEKKAEAAALASAAADDHDRVLALAPRERWPTVPNDDPIPF